MALRGGRREILRVAGETEFGQPRPREDRSAAAARLRRAARMVAAPISKVSWRPRQCSRRSVKTWPRSRSAASWISSMATKSTIEIARHRLDGGDPIARRARLDLLLAGDERDIVRRRRAARRGCRLRAPAAAAASRSCQWGTTASARSRDGSCRCWSGPSTAATPDCRVGEAPSGRESGSARIACRLSWACRAEARPRLITELSPRGDFTFRTGCEQIAPKLVTPLKSRSVHRNML